MFHLIYGRWVFTHRFEDIPFQGMRILEMNILSCEKKLSCKEFEDVHLAQALNYLKAYKLEVGLLINFGSKSMTFKRVVLTNL